MAAGQLKARRSLEFGRVADVLWYVGDSGKLDKGEWGELVSFVRGILTKPHPSPMRAWSIGYGTGPDAVQRRSLLDELIPHDVLVAVNTDSLIARGVVSAFAWYKPNFRAFEIDARDAAARHLELDTATAYRVLQAITAAEERLGPKPARLRSEDSHP
jgi:hypothetical protein